ncbi:hypothetical protein D0C36_15800 [Mucilaginibacter conchicola]|uniref:Immunity MXAN-0049 protein domain-containing protein n=1 Tax=Mucilaginibacter conchicola TaxID=2303333 RepID=A0A372NUZ7_9SPHI|nr:DUF1629 domain-containing protein [Mucilaginibacter conchicola]RFZ92854.1 hypothetical protein D0C36_15800 [Mucilaginibacter conchicola]
MEYYELVDELYVPKKRWFLGSINFDDKWDFWKYVQPGTVNIPDKELFVTVRSKGISLDFTMADFELLVINERVKALLSDKEAQFIPVRFDEQAKVNNDHYLMVVNKDIDCVDESKSIFTKWAEDDPVRPDKAGKYKSFERLILNNDKIPFDANIFRLKKFDRLVIVSEKIKLAFETNNITGVKYKKLTNIS